MIKASFSSYVWRYMHLFLDIFFGFYVDKAMCFLFFVRQVHFTVIKPCALMIKAFFQAMCGGDKASFSQLDKCIFYR